MVEQASSKKTNITASVDEALMTEIREFREGGGAFNISEKVEEGLRSALATARQPSTMTVVERLRRDRTQRTGRDFDLGVVEGMKWARQAATWLELRRYATAIRSIDVEEGGDETGRWIAFADARKQPPAEDYQGPAFLDEDGSPVYEVLRCRRFWAGWLEGLRRVYWEVWDYMDPEAIIGRAEAIGLRVAISRGMAVLIGSLDGVGDRDSTLLSDFSAHREDITRFLAEKRPQGKSGSEAVDEAPATTTGVSEGTDKNPS